ncbi:M14 family zinc carboxypeptidase [Fluviispira vulneris]|uniref:M14 family zinc carboxypeptidase n=1 Tax=Fluviispira vulneris TaxID=2763012 RepID=UPI0016454D3B|nr:M14 family zinc carboxypeptidase [Fluviispira vulneris]
MAIAPNSSKFKFKPLILFINFLISQNIFASYFPLEFEEVNPLPFSLNSFPTALYNLSGLPINALQVLNDSYRLRMQKQISDLCQRVDYTYKKLDWGKSPCFSLPLTYNYVSENGKPLVYWEFADNSSGFDESQRRNVTLILGGVHPDELTPVHLAFQFAEALNKNPNLYKDSRVIIAPLVNPDGFFANPPKRTNANGVDLNRNFPTTTWSKYAYQIWYNSKDRDKRKFPGRFPNSEQGTRFQADLINKFQPNKVISIHAPLAFLDLDYEIPKLLTIGPQTEQQKKARNLTELLSRSAGNYKIKDFGIYPGSLGNYAGNERVIPTITLELSSSNPKLVKKFWRDFSPGIFKALKYEFKKHQLDDLQASALWKTLN